MQRIYWIVLVSIVSICFVPSVRAETRVVVDPFYGPYADQARKEVISTLSKQSELKVVSSGQVDRTASRLGVDAHSRDGRRRVAETLGIAVWIEGIVQRVGSQLRLTVLAYEGKNNERVARYVVTRKKGPQLETGIRMDLWAKTRDALLSAEAPGGSRGGDAAERAPVETASEPDSEESPAAEPESEQDETPSRSAPAASTRSAANAGAPSMALGAAPTIASARWSVSAAGAAPPSGPLPDAIIVGASLGTFTRKLSFSDVQTQSIGDYSLPIAPALGIDARYYPGAHFSSGFASWLGLDLKVGLAFPAASKSRDGAKYSSTVDSYAFGARLRIPVKKHEFSLLGAYSIDRFEFGDSKSRPAPTPDTDYRAIKLGAEAVFKTGEKLSIGLRGAFLIVHTTGEIGESKFFPRLSGNGLEVATFAYYTLSEHLDLTLDLALKRYFFSFNPEPTDQVIAGGASDTFFNLAIGARFRR